MSASRHPGQPYSVPRKFGLGTILLVTALFALLFGIIKWVNAPPAVLIFYCSFVTVVSAAQMALESTPRFASIAAGAVFLPLSAVGAVLVQGGVSASHRLILLGADAGSVVWLIIIGGLLGYLGGTLIAGLVMIVDQLSRFLLWIRRRRFSAT